MHLYKFKVDRTKILSRVDKSVRVMRETPQARLVPQPERTGEMAARAHTHKTKNLILIHWQHSLRINDM